MSKVQLHPSKPARVLAYQLNESQLSLSFVFK